MPKISAVFLDRDGVINKKIEGGYVKSWDEFVFLPEVGSAIKLLNSKNIPVYIISNQSGIGRGIMTQGDLAKVHKLMLDVLKAEGAHVDDIFVCPHAPEDNCECRKPRPGLLKLAKQKHPKINFEASWFIGDSQSDIEAGYAVNANTYLLKKGENLKQVITTILNK